MTGAVINEKEKQELIKLCQHLVRIPSTAEHGKEIYDFVKNYFIKRGLHPEIQKIDSPHNSYFNLPNLYVKIGNGNGPKIMVNGHLDTVAARGDWFYPPHDAIIKDNKLYGLGACDMKGGCAAAIIALLAFLDRRMTINGELFLSFVFGEEAPFSLGVDTMLQEYDISDYDLIIVTEPSPVLTHGDYCYTHQKIHESQFPVPIIGAEGRVMYEIEFFGRAAHASHPIHGINALEDAAVLISKLVDFDLYSSIKMGRGHFVILNIEGGDQTFTVPSYCRILVNRQLTLNENELSATEELKRLINKLNIRSQVHIKKRYCPSSKLEYHPYLFENNEYIEKFIEILPDPSEGKRCRFTTASVGDFNILATRTKVPTLVFGPGGGNIHSPNEYLLISDMIETTNYLLSFFEKIY